MTEIDDDLIEVDDDFWPSVNAVTDLILCEVSIFTIQQKQAHRMWVDASPKSVKKSTFSHKNGHKIRFVLFVFFFL